MTLGCYPFAITYPKSKEGYNCPLLGTTINLMALGLILSWAFAYFSFVYPLTNDVNII